MHPLIPIAAGGAVGAVLRYWVSGAVYGWLGRGFPYGTLAVNLLGSAIMGLLFVLLLERTDLGPEWRGFLLVGLLGAFTTFSTFSLETLNLIEQADYLKAIANMIISVLACVAAAALGVFAGRSL